MARPQSSGRHGWPGLNPPAGSASPAGNPPAGPAGPGWQALRQVQLAPNSRDVSEFPRFLGVPGSSRNSRGFSEFPGFLGIPEISRDFPELVENLCFYASSRSSPNSEKSGTTWNSRKNKGFRPIPEISRNSREFRETRELREFPEFTENPGNWSKTFVFT